MAWPGYSGSGRTGSQCSGLMDTPAIRRPFFLGFVVAQCNPPQHCVTIEASDLNIQPNVDFRSVLIRLIRYCDM